MTTDEKGTFFTLCDHWVKSIAIDGHKMWSQSCEGHSSENRLVLNDEGLIVGIRQFINEVSGELTLRKL